MVSVAVRHSLTGDRNALRAPFTDPGSKGRVLIPLVLPTTRFLVNVFGSFSYSFRVSSNETWLLGAANMSICHKLSIDLDSVMVWLEVIVP